MSPDFIVTAASPSRTLARIHPAAFLHLERTPSAYEDRAHTHVPIPGTQRPTERPRSAREDTQRRAIDGRLNVGENTVNNGEPEARKRRGGERGRDWVCDFGGYTTGPFTQGVGSEISVSSNSKDVQTSSKAGKDWNATEVRAI